MLMLSLYCSIFHMGACVGGIMNKLTMVAVSALALGVASCGGGGSGDGGGGAVSPPPLPTLSTSISSLTFDVDEGNTADTFTVNVNFTGSSSQAIVPSLELGGSAMTLSGTVAANGTTAYQFKLASVAGLGGGEHSGTLTFRLCTDSGCSKVYPGSTISSRYFVDVQLKDWAMHQRNAAHNGYVDAKLNPSLFAQAWVWNPGEVQSAKPAAASDGTVFLSVANRDGTSTAYALAAEDGSEKWRRSLGPQSYVGGPAVANGRVYIMSMETSSSDNPIWYLDATTGAVLQTPRFDSQWSDFFAPVPYDNKLYVSAGYYNDAVYAYDAQTGARDYVTAFSGYVYDKNVPAVDQNYIYHHDGATLNVYRRGDGSLFKSFTDPQEDWAGYSYDAAPVLGANGLILTFGGVGNADWNRGIVAYNVASSNYSWQLGDEFGGIPALAGQTFYVSNHSRGSVQALNSTNGNLRWEWTPTDGNTRGGNVIVTRNLMFFSSSSAVYAVDFSSGSPQKVWEAAHGGHIALTPDFQLIVTDGSSGRVTAYSLN